MLYVKGDINAKLKNVGAKLNAKRDKLIIPGQRDEEAFGIHTTGRILQATKNSYFSGSYFDPVEIMFSQIEEEMGNQEEFSGVGYSAVAEGPSRSAEDITIITAIVSLLPYLAIERAMSDPEASISYENIVAMNDHGLVHKGDIIQGPFKPSNIDVDLSLQTASATAAAGSGATVQFQAPIVKGGVLITYTYDTGKTLTARDYGKAGSVEWTGDAAAITSLDLPGVAIDYDAGRVTLTGTIVADTIQVQAALDGMADDTGDSTIRAKPEFPTTILVAEPKNIILESSLSAEAYRNKMLMSAIEAGMSVNVAETAFRQLMQAYIAYVNKMLVSAIISAGELAKLDQPSGAYIEVDISSYALATSYSDTKNDLVDDFVLRLNTQLMAACGSGASCILVGTIGATKLGNVKNSFVKAPSFMQDVDGYIGTYMGIPVVRHRLVDRASETKYANVYALRKDPSGKAGPIAFGEYTAPVTTDNALNFKNPTQYAKSLFSFVGVKIILPQLVAAGRIKYAA